jgi:hypothetical protein
VVSSSSDLSSSCYCLWYYLLFIMLSSAKRKAAVTSSSPHHRARLSFETPTRTDSPAGVVSQAQDLFIFSPFGLCCRSCNKKIQLDDRSIREHLKRHQIDNRLAVVRPKEKVSFVDKISSRLVIFTYGIGR